MQQTHAKACSEAQEERAKLKERAAAYEKATPPQGVLASCEEYADTSAELVKLRREAKLNGNFFVEPEVGSELVGVARLW